MILSPALSSSLAKLLQQRSTDSYVLPTGSKRYTHALIILFSVLCHIPVLLEGTAATGKSSLVKYLCNHVDIKFLGLNQNELPDPDSWLLRVNNSSETTWEEYLDGLFSLRHSYVGTFVPDIRTGELKFKQGPLVEALIKGHWFLSDEMNLAPESVLWLLLPVLQAKSNSDLFLPGCPYRITCHSTFHFFATQNPASKDYKGRSMLAERIENCFIKLTFSDLEIDHLQTLVTQKLLSAKRQEAPKILKAFNDVNACIRFHLHDDLTDEILSRILKLD